MRHVALRISLGSFLLAAAGCSSGGSSDAGSDGAGSGARAPSGGAGSLGSGGTLAGGAATSGGTAGGGSPNGGGVSSGGSHTGGAASVGGAASGGAPPVGGDANGSGGSSATGGGGAVDDSPQLNGIQWADMDGKLVQAHGAGALKVGEYYYLFGENRNPDGSFLAVSAYRSKDLRHFEFRNDVLKMTSAAELKPANIERPKVVYNPSTQKYVMWMHWENGKDYGEARAAVASSDTVDGDYTYHGSFRPLADSGVMDHGKPGYMSRDCTLYVDDDQKAYFLSAADENYDLNLYLLTADYLKVDKLAATLFPQGHREAPALFKRDDTYFLVTSGATGWDPNQAQFATSTSISSGWSSLQNVGDGTTFGSQSTYVLPVTGTMGTEYLYLGDRWAGAYDGKVNDSQYVWLPITFSSATKMSMSYAGSLQIDTTLGQVRGDARPFRLKNKKSGLFLDTEGGATANSTLVIQADESSASAQAWTLSYNGSGSLELHTNKGGKVIDVPDESKDDGAVLKLWDDTSGAHQGWRVVDLGGGYYRLRNQNSGHYLGVVQGSTTAGAQVEQAASSSSEEQIWQILYSE